MSDAVNVVDERQQNNFKPLLKEARTVLRGILHQSKDFKLAAMVAMDILDRGGETKKSIVNDVRPILIKDSNIQLLVKTAQEVLT